MFKKSLKNKIIFTVFLVLLFAFSGLSFLIFLNTRIHFYDSENKNVINNVVQKAAEIEQIFECSIDVVKTIPTQKKVIDFLKNPLKSDPRPVEEILSQYNMDDEYSIIYLLNNSGDVLVSTDHTLLGNNYSYRSYFKRSLDGQIAVDFNVGATTKEGGFYFSSPVLDTSGEIIGVVVAKLKPVVISENFKIDKSSLDSRFSIVDENGIVIGTNDNTLALYSSFGNLSSESLNRINQIKNYPSLKINNLGFNYIQNEIYHYVSPTAIQLYNQIKKTNEFIGISKINNQPLFIVYSSNLSQTDYGVLENTLILILALTFVSIIMFIFLNWSITIFLRPLSKLKQFAISVSQGNFDQTIDLKTNDEIEDLANVFDETTARLKDMYQGLSDKIQVKTDDLSSKVDELEFSKKAIINLLEDVEKEKEISQQNASDLQKFKLAVDSTSDQIVITDANSIILYANPAAEKNTGFSLNELIGNTPSLWGGQMPDDFYQKLWSQIKDSKQSFSGEMTNIHKDGTKYIAQVQIHPIVGKNGEVIFYVSIERDITKAKEVETMKNDFISVASHQLRTPLGSMRWNLEMLLAGDMGKMPKLIKDTIQEVYGSDTRMLALVNDLLNVSRIDQGRIENIPVDTNIIPIIEDSIKEMDFLATKKKVKIDFNESKIKELIAFVDPKRFREVMQNILSNAVKYNRESGSIKIEIGQNSKETNITVSDTGMGISKKDQEKIFAKFFRASNAVLSETEGSGLGLFVVKSFVESWGGSVNFTSEENVGTTIYIKLPVKKN